MGQPVIRLEKNGARGFVSQNIFEDYTPPLIGFNRVVVGTHFVMRVAEPCKSPTVIVRKLLRLFGCESLSTRLIGLERPQLFLKSFESVERLNKVFATIRFESGSNKLSTFQCTRDLLRTLLCLNRGCFCFRDRFLCDVEIFFRGCFLLGREFGGSLCSFLFSGRDLLSLHCLLFTVISCDCLVARETLRLFGCLSRSLRVFLSEYCCLATLYR